EAGEVVDVAVSVVVEIVPEDPQVAAVERTRAVRVGDARVAGIVLDVEDTVVVAVVGITGWRGAARAGRHRQLGPVEPDLVTQILMVVVDARVEDTDDDVGPAGRHLPGEVGRDAARARSGGD